MLSLSPRPRLVRVVVESSTTRKDSRPFEKREPHWSQEAEEKEKESEKQKICLRNNINMTLTHKRVMWITIEQSAIIVVLMSVTVGPVGFPKPILSQCQTVNQCHDSHGHRRRQ